MIQTKDLFKPGSGFLGNLVPGVNDWKYRGKSFQIFPKVSYLKQMWDQWGNTQIKNSEETSNAFIGY